MTAVYPDFDNVTLSYDDEDDTANGGVDPPRSNVSATKVIKSESQGTATGAEGLSPGLYITVTIRNNQIMRATIKWAIDNLANVLSGFGFISPLADLAASVVNWIADKGISAMNTGNMMAGMFINTDGMGFMLRNLSPGVFLAPVMPLVGALADAFLPTMNFGCTWLSGKSIQCMIDLQGPKWITAVQLHLVFHCCLLSFYGFSLLFAECFINADF